MRRFIFIFILLFLFSFVSAEKNVILEKGVEIDEEALENRINEIYKKHNLIVKIYYPEKLEGEGNSGENLEWRGDLLK